MKTAVYENKVIEINQLSRQLYQTIYIAGKQGKLQCPICGENVRLYLGIVSEPHFFHLSAKKQPCTDQANTQTEEITNDIEYVERNGFKYPVSRSISTATLVQTNTFKAAHPVKKSPPFLKEDGWKTNENPSYIISAKSHGIELDSKQYSAVNSTNDSLLIVAGAGSGKTRVLTARTAYMLKELGINPRALMLVTFTAKAAAEMKERLRHYPNMDMAKIEQLLVGTFHSIFYRILTFHDRERWHSTKLIKKDWQKEQILRSGLRELDIDEKEFALDLAIQQIGFWKNSLLLPKHVKPESPWEEKVLFLYEYYERMKLEQQLFDFDDMLLGCYQLFQENDRILKIYQDRFQYFLIDEFQDINKVQYELIKLLAGESGNICAVGDDDQAIYSFRGSDPQYLLQFEKDFVNAQIIFLDENYRSSHAIVTTANEVIMKNVTRRPKTMKAQFTTEKLPLFFYPYDEEEEATMIVQDIQEKIEKGYEPKDFAILFRTNTGSRAIFERLTSSSLPFKIDQDVEPFYERFLVKGMLSFLQLAINEDDSNAIRQILPSLFIKANVLQDVKANSILQDCTMLECLGTVKTGFAFQESKLRKLVPIIRSLRGLSPVTAIETVEKELGYADFIKKRGNEGNKLEKGSDDIRDLKVAARGFSTIMEFLDHAQHMTAMNNEMKRISKKQTDAITLSTIHRSKGLEYKVVYIVGTVDGCIPHEYALDSYRSGELAPLEEERRLLYVAITRAMEELYISVPEQYRGRKAYPSRFLTPIKENPAIAKR